MQQAFEVTGVTAEETDSGSGGGFTSTRCVFQQDISLLFSVTRTEFPDTSPQVIDGCISGSTLGEAPRSVGGLGDKAAYVQDGSFDGPDLVVADSAENRTECLLLSSNPKPGLDAKALLIDLARTAMNKG